MVDRDSDNIATISEYIDSKSAESGEIISSVAAKGRTLIFAPHVFEIPDGVAEQDLVSVMMPFDVSFSAVYTAIKNATEAADLRCQRADDIWEHATVIQDVFSLIFRSHIVVCDFSRRNPNVFYEAGIAHTLGKHVIPITQNKDDIPFDLSHHRYLPYLNNVEGRDKLTTELVKRLQTLATQVP